MTPSRDKLRISLFGNFTDMKGVSQDFSEGIAESIRYGYFTLISLSNPEYGAHGIKSKYIKSSRTNGRVDNFSFASSKFPHSRINTALVRSARKYISRIAPFL